MAHTLRIHSIETFGTADGPGIRLVVFTQGCLFRCLYCHNPDSQPLESELAHQLTLEELLVRLENERPYFKNNGGLTFSGGEPTVQAKTLLEFLPQISQAQFHTALDTCGAIHDSTVRAVYDQVDLVILDVKHIDPIKHQKLTGHSLNTVLQNAAYRESINKPMWLRYVLVPGYTDDPADIEKWAQTFTTYTCVERVELLPYHTLGVHKYAQMGRPYPLVGVLPPSPERIDQAAAILKRYFKQVVIH